MNTIPTQKENPTGLHQRYIVHKVNGKTDLNAEYFVLRLDDGGSDPKHIEACRIAVNAYASAIEPHIPGLAKDLKKRYPLPSGEGEKMAEGESEMSKAEYYLRCAWDESLRKLDVAENQVKALTAIKKGLETSLSEALARIAQLEAGKAPESAVDWKKLEDDYKAFCSYKNLTNRDIFNWFKRQLNK